MSAVFDLYGLRHQSIDMARAGVEKALSVEFAIHDSSYLGEYFRSGEMDGEHLTLQPNFHPLEQDWIEPEYADVPFLLYVNYVLDSEETRTRLERDPDIRRLRHKVLP